MMPSGDFQVENDAAYCKEYNNKKGIIQLQRQFLISVISRNTPQIYNPLTTRITFLVPSN